MLRKLMKHEFKALGRYFLPMLAFIVILTPLFSIMMRLGFTSDANGITAVMAVLSLTSFIIMLFAMYIAVYIFIILRFYRTTATSEAYLTFTLPAKPSQILCSKLIIAAVYQIITFAVTILSIIGTLFITGILKPDYISRFFDMVRTAFDMYPEAGSVMRTTLILILIGMLISAFASSLQFYCSIMLGQLFNNHRVLISIGMYVGIYIVMQMVSMIVSIPVAMNSIMNSNSVTINDTAFGTEYAINAGDTIEQFIQTMTDMNSSLLVGFTISIVFGVAFYITTVMIMKKKLNVR